MKKLKIPLICEGKYDKIRLTSVIDAHIIPTNGFGVFRSDEKRALIRTLGKNGLVILCDSDGGGKLIRSKLKTMLGGIKIYDIYIPEIPGKERRKSAPSKAGLIGVEGVDTAVLERIFDTLEQSHPELFETSAADVPNHSAPAFTKADMLELGLTGGENASDERDRLAKLLGLPRGMNANALFAALNLLNITPDAAEKMLK